MYPLWQVHVSAALHTPLRHGRLHPGTQFTPVESSDHPRLHSHTFGAAQRPLLHPLQKLIRLNNVTPDRDQKFGFVFENTSCKWAHIYPNSLRIQQYMNIVRVQRTHQIHNRSHKLECIYLELAHNQRYICILLVRYSFLKKFRSPLNYSMRFVVVFSEAYRTNNLGCTSEHRIFGWPPADSQVCKCIHFHCNHLWNNLFSSVFLLVSMLERKLSFLFKGHAQITYAIISVGGSRTSYDLSKLFLICMVKRGQYKINEKKRT